MPTCWASPSTATGSFSIGDAMGEYADLIMNGDVCQECCVFIDLEDYPMDGACGYPRWCYDCGGDPECNGAVKRRQRDSEQNRSKPFRCDDCGKRTSTQIGLSQHRAAVHFIDCDDPWCFGECREPDGEFG